MSICGILCGMNSLDVLFAEEPICEGSCHYCGQRPEEPAEIEAETIYHHSEDCIWQNAKALYLSAL